MSIRKTTVLLTSGIICSIALSSTALANTCPIELKRNHNGYWYSDTKPGWKSHRTTKVGVTLSADNFGGIVYSPKRHRMACVYKASNGKWIALVSNLHRGIVIDKSTMDNSGKKAAWKYSIKHKDYACGQPSVTKISKCSFQLEKKKKD